MVLLCTIVTLCIALVPLSMIWAWPERDPSVSWSITHEGTCVYAPRRQQSALTLDQQGHTSPCAYFTFSGVYTHALTYTFFPYSHSYTVPLKYWRGNWCILAQFPSVKYIFIDRSMPNLGFTDFVPVDDLIEALIGCLYAPVLTNTSSHAQSLTQSNLKPNSLSFTLSYPTHLHSPSSSCSPPRTLILNHPHPNSPSLTLMLSHSLSFPHPVHLATEGPASTKRG